MDTRIDDTAVELRAEQEALASLERTPLPVQEGNPFRAQHIAERLSQGPDLLDERAFTLPGDEDSARKRQETSGRRLREAGVLVPLIERREGLTVLFTRRADHLPKHAGQISFPGGSREKHDADIFDTALRETEEEVGLSRERVQVIGRLANYQTGTGFIVAPIVGVVAPDLVLSPDENEVAEVFEVPLDFLMDSRNHQRMSRVRNGERRRFYAMTYKDRFIWGATAGILVDFHNRVTAP